jgi:hypothetical protein
VSKAVEAGATAAKVAANTVTKTGEALQGAVIPAASVIGQIATQVPGAVSGADLLSGKVLDALPTSPDAIQRLAAQQAMKTMTGGGGGGVPLADSFVSNTLFLGLTLIMMIGSFQALKRLNPNFAFFHKKEKDDGRQRNDTPPQPPRI